MVRTFHPVGHGAFYTEFFNFDYHEKEQVSFRVVYDCGTKTSKKLVNPQMVIKDAFNDGEDIDILFISHFDKDHVSMIQELLKDNRKVKNAVLPLLSKEDEAILLALYSDERNEIGYKLLDDPASVLGKDTTIIYIEPSDSESDNGRERRSPDYPENFINNPDNSEDIDIIDPNGKRVKLHSGRIVNVPSGTVLSLSHFFWCYIPHNYKYQEQHDKLLNILESKGIDQNKLSDTRYIDTNRKKLNEIYNLLEENINVNSMIVYSGPTKLKIYNSKFHFEIFSDWPRYIINPACIFSGDSDFKKVKIHEIYKEFWDKVGTIQIPHHGSNHNFSSDFLEESKLCFFCPISVRSGDAKHPASTVTKEISTHHSIPIIVDENEDSKLIQTVWDNPCWDNT